MDEPPYHPVMIVGLGYGGRAQYIARHVSIGDPVDLRLEADNPYDPFTIAAFHRDRHIGYIAPGWRWVAHALEQGDRLAAIITAFEYGARDDLTAVMIEITFLKEVSESISSPALGTAPWAPRIVYAPRPRWPVLIPLGLLAALAAVAWMLMEWGFLPQIARLTGAP